MFLGRMLAFESNTRGHFWRLKATRLSILVSDGDACTGESCEDDATGRGSLQDSVSIVYPRKVTDGSRESNTWCATCIAVGCGPFCPLMILPLETTKFATSLRKRSRLLSNF